MKPEVQDLLEDLHKKYGIALYGFSKKELMEIRKSIDLVIKKEGNTIETEEVMHYVARVEFDNLD